jgi:phage terminase small subunit
MSTTSTLLNDRQELFCQEYLVDLNGSAAAVRAGYSEKGSRVAASKLMDRLEVRQRIQELMNERTERVQVTADEVLQELLAIAKVDINAIFGPSGELLPISEIPEATRRAIASVDVYKDFTEGVEIGETKKIKLWDKLRALELLGKHLKLFGPEVLAQNNTQVNVQMNANAETARVLDKIEDGRWDD